MAERNAWAAITASAAGSTRTADHDTPVAYCTAGTIKRSATAYPAMTAATRAACHTALSSARGRNQRTLRNSQPEPVSGLVKNRSGAGTVAWSSRVSSAGSPNRRVTDNLNTHTTGCLYEAFPPEQARRIAARIEWHYTPKHGSWLNMAEIEFAALSKQCLDRRIGSIARLRQEVAAWEEDRNERMVGVKWRFNTADARVKLRSLYPPIKE